MGTVQQKLFDGIGKLEKIRSKYSVFDSGADVWTIDTWDDGVLGFIRANATEKLIVLLNFSEYDKTAWIDEDDGGYTDLISGHKMYARGVNIPAYGAYWLYRKRKVKEEV